MNITSKHIGVLLLSELQVRECSITRTRFDPLGTLTEEEMVRRHQGTCYEEILDEGDVPTILETHHQTHCVLVEPKRTTVTLTGTVVNAYNYRELSNMMHGECVRDRLSFKFSAALCDALDECVDLWHKRYRTDSSSSRSVWIPWREVATKKMIHKMETDDWYLGNNYDGRNPISGK